MNAEKTALQGDLDAATDAPVSLARAASHAVCACKPGTHAEGWQERRSQACLDRERDAWKQMLTRYAMRNSPEQATP